MATTNLNIRIDEKLKKRAEMSKRSSSPQCFCLLLAESLFNQLASPENDTDPAHFLICSAYLSAFSFSVAN